MKTYAVLTGDIVESSKIDAQRLEFAKSLLRSLAAEFAQAYPESMVGQPDVFRGDSWQIGLLRPGLALTAAVFIRSGFKMDELDTRIGIGWGGVDRIHTDRISESLGAAFTRSGQALDGLGKVRRLALISSDESNAPFPGSLLDAGVGLLDALVSRWTQSESVAVYGTLRKLSQDAIAELPKARTKDGRAPTRQAIQDALRRISWAGHIQPFLSSTERFLEMDS